MCSCVLCVLAPPAAVDACSDPKVKKELRFNSDVIVIAGGKAAVDACSDPKVKKELRFNSDVIVIAGNDTWTVRKHSQEALGELSNARLTDRRGSGIQEASLASRAHNRERNRQGSNPDLLRRKPMFYPRTTAPPGMLEKGRRKGRESAKEGNRASGRCLGRCQKLCDLGGRQRMLGEYNNPDTMSAVDACSDPKVKKELRFNSDVIVIAGNDTWTVRKHSQEALGELSNARLTDRRGSGIQEASLASRAHKQTIMDFRYNNGAEILRYPENPTTYCLFHREKKKKKKKKKISSYT
ncbi:hypothetical protein EGW08_019210 [Elysia chlorotica]|uniref:FAD/NAD(P)-binding domain-containing protein n=1 Tax=Elysia chlorotica TaxID=188477 RepID=A0A433SUP3_ELYCH|nr:hypothetical protein EGW08_019210 [Elysia chlorotica]